MPYHDWGDEDFDWKALYSAERFIVEKTFKWTRCRLSSKEKYGTIRYEWVIPPFGGLFLRNKLQVWWVQTWLYRQWRKLGWIAVKHAAFKAAKKWPHVEDEILCDLASDEWLVGKEMHEKYWTKL